MKRIYLAIGLCIIAGWLAGCGGGQSGTQRASRGTGTVQLKITIPPRSAFAAQKPGSRLIPGNTVMLRISYTAVDNTGALVTPTTPTPEGVACAATTGVICVAVTPTATPTTASQTLTSFAAGYANLITIDALDGNNNKVATANTTLNINPGDTTTQAAVTLATTISSTGTPTFTVVAGQANALTAGLNASQSVTVQAQFTNAGGHLITPTQSTAVPPAYGLTWTGPSTVSVTTNANGTATITSLQPGAGTATISVTYQEYGQTIQSGSFTLTLNNPSLTALATLSYKESDGATAVPTSALFDVSSDGNTLFYDSLLVIAANDAFPGYSRIVPPAAVSLANPPNSDVVDFDVKAGSTTYTGADSRLAYLPAATAWAVVGNALGAPNNTTVTAFASGDHARAVTAPPALWTYTPGGATTIIDVDAKGATATSLVYLLEQTGASSYQIETRKQADGTAGTTIPVILGYAPTNLAVTLIKNGGGTVVETDYYLSGASKISQLRVPVSGVPTLQTDFTNSAVTPITPIDIATSDDGRFLFELDGAGKIDVFSALSGTQLPATKNLTGTLIPSGGGITGSRLSAGTASSNVYVIDQSAGVPQMERYQLQ